MRGQSREGGRYTRGSKQGAKGQEGEYVSVEVVREGGEEVGAIVGAFGW